MSPRLAVTALLITLSLSTAGCVSHSAVQTERYLLPAARQASAAPGWVRIHLPPYLAQDGLIMELDSTRLHSARQHRWADPLDKQLQRILARQLDKPDGQLDVWVTRFQGSADGQAVIDASWRYQGDSGQQSGDFQWQEPLAENGYAGLVKALNQGWGALSDRLRNAWR